MIKTKPTLTIIQSTHVSMSGLDDSGLLDRHKRLLTEYSRTFGVVVYSSDDKDYSSQLNIKHCPVPWLPKAFGWRHLIFYIWLVVKAPRMKGVIKVFGSNIPTLPLVKLLSHRPMMVTYQWNYAEQTRRGEKTGLKHWLAPLLEKLALWSADLVLVTAKWLEEKIRNIYAKKTILLPNWVDLGSESTDSKEAVRNEHLILYAGRMHWTKGVNILIDAFVEVKLRQPRAQLVLCGTGEEEERLLNQVEKLGLSDVQFKGRVPNTEVLKLMRSAAIFVLPTLTMEGHPKALIEALACGAACVASNVPGNHHVITDGKNGILVPPYDVQSLSRAISKLLLNAGLRQRLSSNAETEAARYDFTIIVSKEIEILIGLLAGK